MAATDPRHAADALVLDRPGGSFTLQPVSLAPVGDDEVLVRIAGVGLCHTDLAVWAGSIPFPLPGVLGHEGAGTVVEVGSKVERLSRGDRVVLSFRSCGQCRSCDDHAPAYCTQFGLHNFAGVRPDGTATVFAGEQPLGASFFGQSSFASHAIAHVNNAVKVDEDLPIALLGPLGCGIQTGAGAIMRSLACGAGSSLLVTGAGSVGMSAVLGAVLQGCATIIVAEPHEARRELALALGATHVIDPAGADLAASVSAICPGGVDFALDTTAVQGVIEAAFASLGPRGRLGLVGAPRQFDDSFAIPMAAMVGGGKAVCGIMEGDSDPQRFIPELLAHFRAGRFPFDRLIRTYPLGEIDRALADLHDGHCVKAVMLPEA